MTLFNFSSKLRWSLFPIHIGFWRNPLACRETTPTYNTDFFRFANEVMKRYGRYASSSTSMNYATAITSLRQFLGGGRLPLRNITTGLMTDYEHYLRHQGLCLNTTSCYLRALRSLYNKAVDEGLTPQQHPFRLVFTGREATSKRSISADDIRRLASMKLQRRSKMAFTRDIFLFSFYACGMPFVDVALLHHSQLCDGYLHYRRRKTGRRVRVKLLPCMQEIIDRWALPRKSRDGLVFPILPKGDIRCYASQLSLYNRRLATLARRCGLRATLSSYVARHTWASLAREQLIDVPVIAQGLGHTNTRTTQIYMRDINDNRLDEANERLLQHVLQ